MKQAVKQIKVPKQLTAARYGTRQGNLWFTTATWGNGAISYGVDINKDKARKLANTKKFKGSIGRPDWIYNVGEQYLKGSIIENNGKQPMLIVGANGWIREKIPFFMLQRYDIYAFFAPTVNKYWQLGFIAMDRQNGALKPLFTWIQGKDTNKALSIALYSLLIEANQYHKINKTTELKEKFQAKRNLWWTLWIYRCPKITLKDVLHLKPYKNKRKSA